MVIPFIGDLLQHIPYVLLLPGLQFITMSVFLLELFSKVAIDGKWKRFVFFEVLFAVLIELIGILPLRDIGRVHDLLQFVATALVMAHLGCL